MNPKTLQLIMGHSFIQVALDTYVHLEETDVKKEFLTMVENRNYDFYPLDRVPEIVAPDDDELPDDDDEVDVYSDTQ